MSEQAGWWQSIEEHLAERESEAPDPWGDDAVETSVLTHDQAEMLEKGRGYVNVHTKRNPNGEIRGQLRLTSHA